MAQSGKQGSRNQTVLDRLKIIFGITVVAAGTFFVIIFYIFFASGGQMYFYYPYTYPETITMVQTIFPIALALIGLIMFLLIAVLYKCIRHRPLKKSLTVISSILAVLSVGGSGIMLYFASPNIPFWFYDAGPYLTWSNNQDASTGITVNWHSSWTTGSSVRYGSSPDHLDFTATSSDFSQFHHVRIDGLLPNTTYYYRVDLLNAGMKSFKTAPVGNATFSFCVWSDPRENNPYDAAITGPNMPAIMEQQTQLAGKKREFSVCCGDITARGVDRQTWKLWLEDICTNDFACNYSHAVSFGNHERHDDTVGRNLPLFYRYDPTTYSFTYGQVHCILLDPWNVSNAYWSYIPANIYMWMEEDLQAHANSSFTILAVHAPPVFWDGSVASNPADTGGSGAIGTQIVALASAYNIDAVFSGHWHGFWKYNLTGTLYYGIGIGGAESSGYGYGRVDVNATAMVVNAIHAETNTIFDTATILA
nr:fibronectin type III domain-containing protein [Candidatus Sigynarchaeota archaeon]